MNNTFDWAHEKSELSAMLARCETGDEDESAVIDKIDALISHGYSVDEEIQQELIKIISGANFPKETTQGILTKLYDQKTRIVSQKASRSSQEPADQDHGIEKQHSTHSLPIIQELEQWGDVENEPKVQPDQIIRGTYRLVHKIGRGGMGEVWKAVDLIQEEGEARDKFAAIKFINEEIKRHPYAIKALVREFARYRKLIHPNIVKAYELNRDKSELFIAMEYLQGTTLKEFIKEHPQGISLKSAKPIIKSMCDALQYAHREGIIHLDFKPGNVFYDPATHICKVIDFGIARLANPEERDVTLFDPGKLGAVTTAYASCEMITGMDPDPRDDVYALACVVYELLSGRHPFNKTVAIQAERENLLIKPVDGLNSEQFNALRHALNFRRDLRTVSVEQFFAELFPEEQPLGQQTGGIQWIFQKKVIIPLLVVVVIIFSYVGYRTYRTWQLNNLKSAIIEQQYGFDHFAALNEEQQKTILNDSRARLSLLKMAAAQQHPQGALETLQSLSQPIQTIVLSDQNGRYFLIDHYYGLIEQAIANDDFGLAQQLSTSILHQYQDSLRLAEQARTIDRLKLQRIATTTRQLQQCLSDKSKSLITLFPCISDNRGKLTYLDQSRANLGNAELNERYSREVASAIDQQHLKEATTLLGHWNTLVFGKIAMRSELENKLRVANQVNDLKERFINAGDAALTSFLTRVFDIEDTILQTALTDEKVKQRLVNYYEQQVMLFLEEAAFSKASNLVNQGMQLLSKHTYELQRLKALSRDIEKKKSAYLATLQSEYQHQLTQIRPDTQKLQYIVSQFSKLRPDSGLSDLPGVAQHYVEQLKIAMEAESFALAEQLLSDWQTLMPAVAETDVFTELQQKRLKRLQVSKDREIYTQKLDTLIGENQITPVLSWLSEVNNHFDRQDQEKILLANATKLYDFLQAKVDQLIQQNDFAAAQRAADQMKEVLPKDKHIQAIHQRVKESKSNKIKQLLDESETALHADTLLGQAIFSPLEQVRRLDENYLSEHLGVLRRIATKLKSISNNEEALVQMENVIVAWENYYSTAGESFNDDDILQKTKNLIALRCLIKGRKLNNLNKPELAGRYFIFALSLRPSIPSVREALEKEVLNGQNQ